MQTDEIYQKYARTVYRYLLSETGDPSLSEELTQETFVEAIRTVDRYDESVRMSTWLIGIAKNVHRSYLRKHPAYTPIEDVEIPTESAEDQVIAAAEKVKLFRLLHELPEPYREIIYLRVFGALSFREIGEILGRNENWARVTYYRGKEQLKKEVENNERIEMPDR